ncbi:F-box protein [Citrus sinensis]|uniref:F-box protein n=1 Tax=Citrus sinensis TaxID=2711 RepID=A0ACB8L366_CITSI|nr:F-box protein [Citrus sinensis]
MYAKGMDRITELPTFIIHHIMSYLSAKEIARTSILSKRWYLFCISFPILEFDQCYFLGKAITLMDISDEKKFMAFVEASLFRFCKLRFRMQELRLFQSFLDVKGSAPLLDKWIGLAVDNGIKDLVLMVHNMTQEDTVCILPQTIFSAKSMATLSLFGCRMEQPSDTTTIRLDSLKKLTLENVYINDQMFQKLTNECPSLEDFEISACWGLKNLCVSKAHKLKKLAIYTFYKDIGIVEIVVPSLQQQLMLTSVWFMDEEFDRFISKFPLLEDLLLRFCRLPEKVKISSNQLKNLHFNSCENLKAIDTDTPNLLSFTFSNLDMHWYLRLKKFLGVAKQIENLKLSLETCEVSFNLDELSGCSPSLPLQVGTLELYANVPLSDYETLLDGVFQICYPRTLRVSTMFEEDKKLIEVYISACIIYVS